MRSAFVCLLLVVGCHDDAATSKSPPRDGGCPEGWHASMTEWMDGNAGVITIGCAVTGPTVTITRQERSHQARSGTHEITPEQWVALWKQLDAARWRELDSSCPESGVVVPPEMSGPTKVFVSISDRKTSKWYECAPQNMTAQHDEILKAFELAISFVVAAYSID